MRAAPALILPALLALAGPAVAAAEAARMVPAATTEGTAVLKLCRDWLLWDSCREYGRIPVPKRIAVGDTLPIDFGSNAKSILFRIKSITLIDGQCRLLREGEAGEMLHDSSAAVDMLIIKPCGAVE